MVKHILKNKKQFIFYLHFFLACRYFIYCVFVCYLPLKPDLIMLLLLAMMLNSNSHHSLWLII